MLRRSTLISWPVMEKEPPVQRRFFFLVPATAIAAFLFLLLHLNIDHVDPPLHVSSVPSLGSTRSAKYSRRSLIINAAAQSEDRTSTPIVSNSLIAAGNLMITDEQPAAAAFRLLIAVMIRSPENYAHRYVLRDVYAAQKLKISHIDVRFVFCNLTTEEQRVFVSLEIMRYGDIIILNCSENNSGGGSKTHAFFSSLPDMFDTPFGTRPSPYDYVMKTSDQVFFRLDRLEETIEKLPRQDLYFGSEVNTEGGSGGNETTMKPGQAGSFMVSWDLVDYIANSSYAGKHSEGQDLEEEDRLVAEWFREGKVAKNRVDLIKLVNVYKGSDQFMVDAVLVYGLKEIGHWIDALRFYNMTNSLENSRLYHVVS